MKFNMTKSESALFLKRILNLTGQFTKEQMIAKFMYVMAMDVKIIDKA